MDVWHFGVLGRIRWNYRVAWLALLWSPAWNFWYLAAHDLGWVRWIVFVRHWWRVWNWVAVWIYRYDAAVWSVDNGVAAVWIIRGYGVAAHALLVGSVALNYWSRYFSVLVAVWLIPGSRGLASDFVLGRRALEGWSVRGYRLALDYLAILVLVDVGYGLLAFYLSIACGLGVIIRYRNRDIFAVVAWGCFLNAVRVVGILGIGWNYSWLVAFIAQVWGNNFVPLFIRARCWPCLVAIRCWHVSFTVAIGVVAQELTGVLV